MIPDTYVAFSMPDVTSMYLCLVLLQVTNFFYVLCQSQTFCARQKDDLHSVKLVFVPAQMFLKRPKCSQIFGLAQKMWTDTKQFGLAQTILGPVKGQGISASSKTFVPAQQPILLNANHLFSGTKCL